MPTDPWDYDEDLARQVLTWTEERLRRDPSPFTGARPRDELEAAAGETVTEGGLGFDEAFRVFTDVLVPATRAQDHPLNLAYIPNAPTEAARLMDVVVSVSSIFGGVWEAGAGAIFAENQALDWLRQLAGFPESAGGCFVSGATVGTLSALAAARGAAGPRPAGGWRIAATAEGLLAFFAQGLASTLLSEADLAPTGLSPSDVTTLDFARLVAKCGARR